MQKAHHTSGGGPYSCQADFKPNSRGCGKAACKVCEASGEALQGKQPLSRCKACNRLKVGAPFNLKLLQLTNGTLHLYFKARL